MDSASGRCCRSIGRDLELLAVAFLIAFATSHVAAAGSIGINYGRLGDNLPTPDQVVALLAANNITKTRIFDSNSDVINAFANNNSTNSTNSAAIQLSVSIPNEQLQTIAASATSAASWVSANLAPVAGRLVIPTISVGNEVLTNGATYAPYLLPAMRNILSALQPYPALSGVTRVSTPHAFNVMDAASFPPSKGAFNASLVPSLRPILDFLNTSGGPFMINVYPFFSYAGDPSNVPLDYALFGAASNGGVTDSGNGLYYGNLFDAMVDTTVAALGKLGYPNMSVVVTETGWPSKGEEPGATTANAARYNQNLIQHVQSAGGTPLRPGITPETYIFALFNENQKTGPTSERNFGLFQPNKAQVYSIRLS